MSRNSTVIGYILDDNGNYDEKKYIENIPENIADFILNNSLSEVIVTDIADNLLLRAIGGFIHQCPNQEYLNHILLPVLISKQLKS